MIETVQIEELRETSAPPNLLVEWSSRSREFVECIKPAFARSERRLAGEAPFGLVPLRIMIPSYVIEAFLILSAIFVQVKIEELRPHVVTRVPSHDVIYYTGDELPRTEDLGGAETGKSGDAGGEETFHKTQTIKVARGGSRVSQVVDAPNLKLPSSTSPVANLLAVRPDPGPPPAEGLRSSRTAPNLAATVVAPAPNVLRDYTRNGIRLESVIAPAPSVQREQIPTAPTFNETPIPPAPNVANNHTLVAPRLTPAVIAPAPSVSRERTASALSLNPNVVAPAPNVNGDRTRSGPALSANVIPPAPGGVRREFSSAPVQMTNAAVVPPPVSAPERASNRNAKISLPAPSVVAPPPSADLSSDIGRLASGSAPDPARTVVPPPPSQSGSGSFMSSLIGRIFGPSEVVPPPPSVNSKSSGGSTPSLAANVVAPPPSVASGTPSGRSRASSNGMGASLGSNVVAPPPSIGVAGGNGTRASSAPALGTPSVVQPPPQLAGPGGGPGTTGGGAGANGGALLADNIVPPPPSLGSGTAAIGPAAGRKGPGLGAPSDVGSALAQAKNGGSGTNAGAVISSQPGSKVALPTSGSSGSLAMSPSGGSKTGVGGSGNGAGIGHGTGPGSGTSGTGTGAGKSANGHGADTTVNGGMSPTNGPGGAGAALSGTPPVRGVEVAGGSTIVTLPSFGGDPGAAPSAPDRTSLNQKPQALGVTVVATAGSAGAFEPYKKLLKGENYVTYIDTSLGTVVMEFADEKTALPGFGGTLTAPTPLRTDLAEGLPKARMVVACTLDASGNLRNVHVLEAGPPAMTAKVIAALRTTWKFEPAKRSNQPVEVTAILGFGIDTNDRF